RRAGEGAVELGPILWDSDPLVLQPGPVLVPVVAADRTCRVDLVRPQLDVLVDGARRGCPAVAPLHVAEMEVRLDIPLGLVAQLGEPRNHSRQGVERARLAERVCGV